MHTNLYFSVLSREEEDGQFSPVSDSDPDDSVDMSNLDHLLYGQP